MTMIDDMVDVVPTNAKADLFLGELAKVAIDAQVFVFDMNAKAAMQQLAHAGPVALQASLSLCRLPFQNCWFEWPGKDVLGVRSQDNGKPQPSKIGALVTAMGESSSFATCQFVWQHAKGSHQNWWDTKGLEVCGRMQMMDWSDTPSSFIRRIAIDTNVIDRKWAPTAEAKGAAIELAHRCVTAKSPFLDRAFKFFTDQGRLDLLSAIDREAEEDIVGEMLYVMAALCLLNSRNCVTLERADLEKVNKARVKSRKRPLVSYSTVKIALSKSEQRIAKARGLSPEEIRRHIVRGHFKVKRKGVYWWRPHLRGSLKAGEVRRDHYEVAQAPEQRDIPEAAHG